MTVVVAGLVDGEGVPLVEVAVDPVAVGVAAGVVSEVPVGVGDVDVGVGAFVVAGVLGGSVVAACDRRRLGRPVSVGVWLVGVGSGVGSCVRVGRTMVRDGSGSAVGTVSEGDGVSGVRDGRSNDAETDGRVTSSPIPHPARASAAITLTAHIAHVVIAGLAVPDMGPSVVRRRDGCVADRLVASGRRPPPTDYSARKPAQDFRQLLGRLLGHVVTGPDPGGPDRPGAPARPDPGRVPVERLHVVAHGPGDQGRTRDPAPRQPVGLVVCPVHMQACPVVLQHRSHCLRSGDRADEVLVALLAHEDRSGRYHSSGSATMTRSARSLA